jgi:PAP2 superfamily
MKSLSNVALAVLAVWATTSWAGPDVSQQTSTSATLTWNRIALEAVERAKPTQHQAARLLAQVSIAQYAAAAGASSEDAVRDAIATASARVIAELIPSQTVFVEERYRELQPRGNDNGRLAAQRVLAEANNDGFGQQWSGQAPQAAYAWRSLANPPAPPAYPRIGAMRTFFLESGSAFRSAPPPELGSARFVDALTEVRRHTQSPTQESTRMAKFYEMTTGTLAAGFWNEQATVLISKSALGEQQAAGILATVNAAIMDALVACHDTKYVYWVPRPSQADPSIKPLIGVPNHPSYPSNHSCLSTAAAFVLSHFFPQNNERFKGIATEAGLSRIYAGLHYRFDVEAGEDIGRKVAAAAIARYAEMLARWNKTLLGAN